MAEERTAFIPGMRVRVSGSKVRVRPKNAGSIYRPEFVGTVEERDDGSVIEGEVSESGASKWMFVAMLGAFVASATLMGAVVVVGAREFLWGWIEIFVPPLVILVVWRVGSMRYARRRSVPALMAFLEQAAGEM